jgi:hypothetical protein
MMRVLLLSIMMMGSGTSAWAANNNPWMRACRIDQGQFWVLNVGNHNDLALCFFGNSGVGAEALFLFKTNAGVPLAIQAYKNRNSSPTGGGVCGSFGADLVQGKDSEGQTFNICRFSDQSLIEETTLWMGPGSVDSADLDKALSSTY